MKFIQLVFLFLVSSALAVGLTAQQKINWLSWEEALIQQKNTKKKIVVDVVTEWCTWCKKMDSSTYLEPHVINFINENYVAIKFDAEQKEDIIFNNNIYKLVTGFGKRKYHELAFEIMNGKISYPTLVFLDEDLEVIQPIPGYKDAQTIEMILNYFAYNHYKDVPWKKFTQTFSSPNYQSRTSPKSVQPPVQTVKNRN